MIYPNSKGFFGDLKENWWKQVIDGKYHHLGKEVFDKGLHKKHVEPGYLESARKASKLARQNLGKKVDVEFYKLLNKTACSHFSEVSRDQVNMDADKAGTFRNVPCRYVIPIAKRTIAKVEPFGVLTDVERNTGEYRASALDYLTDRTRYSYLFKKKDMSQAIGYRYVCETEYTCSNLLNGFLDKGLITTEDVELILEADNKIDEEIEKIIVELEEIRETLKIEHPLVSIKKTDQIIYVFYKYNKIDDIEAIANKIFNEYYKNLEQPTDSEEEKLEAALKAIASLFQKLEWLHPFADGQGRTDLILLSKLLVEQGFNPPIFYDPYLSTTSTLNDWIDYLKRGITKGREEKE